jgi:hypothetical protein
MRSRTPTQPTPLTPAQTARLRTLDIRLLAISAAVYLALAALALTPWPNRIIIPLTIAAYAPIAVQFIRFRAGLALKLTQPLILEYPSNLLHTGAFMSCAMLAGACMFVLLTPDAPGFVLLFMPCIGVALTLLTASSFSFVLSPPSCPACHYPLEGLDFPLPCPECGRPIESARDALTCRKLRKPGLRLAGVACFVLPLLGSTVFSANPGLITTRLPRPARLALAPTDTAAFTSVVQNLTPEERDRLITRILDARTHDNMWLMYDQLAWLGNEHAQSRLTPEQAGRFASEPMRFAIQADPVRRVGLPIRLYLTADTPPAINSPTHFHYFTRGFEIDGSMLPIEPPRPFPTLALQATHAANADQLVPLTTFTPDHPGQVIIRIHIIAVTTTSPTPTITWHDDQSFTITPQPFTTHIISAETTLEIAP